MNATTRTTASEFCPGVYTWSRPGAALCATLDTAGAWSGTLTNPVLGTLEVPSELLPAEVLHAIHTCGVRFAPLPPVYLTRQRARDMHRELGRLGLPADDRYALAARLTGRAVESLTALTESEARDLLAAARAERDAQDRAAEPYLTPANVTAQGADWLGL